MRLGEAFGIVWEDIDFEAKTISISRQLQWDASRGAWYITEPKYNSIRTIEIDDGLLSLLGRTKAHQEKAREYFGERYIRIFVSSEKKINIQGDGDELHLVNVREDGGFIQPRIMQHTSSIIHTEMHFPEFDFHSFRHPYVKLKTKLFTQANQQFCRQSQFAYPGGQ